MGSHCSIAQATPEEVGFVNKDPCFYQRPAVRGTIHGDCISGQRIHLPHGPMSQALLLLPEPERNLLRVDLTKGINRLYNFVS